MVQIDEKRNPFTSSSLCLPRPSSYVEMRGVGERDIPTFLIEIREAWAYAVFHPVTVGIVCRVLRRCMQMSRPDQEFLR